MKMTIKSTDFVNRIIKLIKTIIKKNLVSSDLFSLNQVWERKRKKNQE